MIKEEDLMLEERVFLQYSRNGIINRMHVDVFSIIKNFLNDIKSFNYARNTELQIIEIRTKWEEILNHLEKKHKEIIK